MDGFEQYTLSCDQTDGHSLYWLFEFLPVPVLISEVVGRDSVGRQLNLTRFVNREYRRIIGYTLDEHPDINTAFELMFPDAEYREQMRDHWERVVREAMAGDGRPMPDVAKIRCRDGRDRWFSAIADLSGAICPDHHIITFVNVTAQMEAQAKLRTLSETDALTGLNTRRVILDEIKHLENLPRPVPVSLVMCDIDRFKRINDDFGHETGDRALQYIGRLLAESIRQDDLAARWGGEEFLLLLPDTTAEVAAGIVARIHSRLNTVESWQERFDRPITLTFGIAAHVKSEPFAETIRRADLALYRGKAAGRNRIVVHNAGGENDASNDPVGLSILPNTNPLTTELVGI